MNESKFTQENSQPVGKRIFGDQSESGKRNLLLASLLIILVYKVGIDATKLNILGFELSNIQMRNMGILSAAVLIYLLSLYIIRAGMDIIRWVENKTTSKGEFEKIDFSVLKPGEIIAKIRDRGKLSKNRAFQHIFFSFSILEVLLEGIFPIILGIYAVTCLF